MKARAALAAVPALWLAGCFTIHDATVWNLRELHNPDGSFRRVGARVSNLEYYLRFKLLAFTKNSSRYRNPSQKPIEDPAGDSFTKILDLAGDDSSDPDVRRDEVEWFAFLGIDSPWKLVRERCVIELGKLGRARHLAIEPRPEGELAGPEEVGEALRQIVSGSEDLLAGRSGGHEKIAAGCQAMDALVLSRRGALSAHRGLSALLSGIDDGDPRFGKVVACARRVEDTLLRRALEEALADDDPLVVAAAIRANYRTFGRPILVPILGQLIGGGVEYDEVVIEAVLRLLRDGGLPDVSQGPAAALYSGDPEAFRLQLLGALVEIGSRHPSGSVRLLALEALAAVTGEPLPPREELWRPWWRAYQARWKTQREEAGRDALERELQRLREEGAVGGDGGS